MSASQSSQTTILFADIAGSTRLYDTFGDIQARELIRDCLSMLKQLAFENDGSVIKTIGDEILCTFATPDQAAMAAKRMHEEVSFDAKMTKANIRLRIGLHYGEVISDPGDLFGDAVNVASRMVDLAKSDQIITNKETLSLMRKSLRYRARMVDRTRVRGKDDIMEIHELIWGRPEQMTMTSSLTEELVTSLSSEHKFLKICYQEQNIFVENERPFLTIGRGMANHLVVNDPVVSRMHARIELRRGRFMLIDQSTNGTFLKPSGETPLILRRDELTLEREGIIGLGQKVDQNHPFAIHYRVL